MTDYRNGINQGMNDVETGQYQTDLNRSQLSADFKCGYLLGFGYKQIQLRGHQRAEQSTVALARQYPELKQRFIQELTKLGFKTDALTC